MAPNRGHTVTPAPNRLCALSTLAALLAAVLLTSPGCVPELGCEDLGCDPGKVCDESSGECVDRTCTPDSCPAGERCDESSGECLPVSDRCGPGHPPCPSGSVCHTSRETGGDGIGICEPETDCAAEGCSSPVEICDDDSGECVPKSCEEHSDCPAPGYICGETGNCTAGCLLDRQNCPTGQNCSPVSRESRADSGDEIGRCLQSCQSNQECPHGRYCPESTCEPEPPCEEDRDCPRDDEVCRSGRCDAPPCRSDEDCPSEQHCDRATGTCLGGSCADDNFARNYTWETAAEITFDQFAELRLCRGRSDWFSIPTDSSESIRVRLSHGVEHDLDLMIYDEEGQIIGVDEQAPPADVERGQFVSSTSFISNRDQTVRIRVFSHRREETSSERAIALPETASYDLEIERATDSFCKDDRYEENDRRSEADRLPSDVGAAPQYSFTICEDDVDWYQLTDVPAYSKFQTRLVDVPPEADHLRFAVLSESGRRFVLTPDQALTLLRTGPKQDWYLLVYSNTDASAEYGIRYTVANQYQCPEAGEHGDIEEALSLEPRIATTYQLCPMESSWEVDWVKLQSPSAPSPMRLTVIPEASGGVPPLDVDLFERQTSGLRLLRSAAETEKGYGMDLDIDPQQSLFLRVSADGAPGLLQFEPKYRLRYEYRRE